MSEFTVHVLEPDGTDLGIIATAVPGPYTFGRRFKRGEFTFTFSVWDPVVRAHLPMEGTLEREIALYESGTLRFLGKPGPWKPSMGAQTVLMRVYSLEWAYERRFFGWAERINGLLNGSFDDSPTVITPWSVVGAATSTIVPAIAEGAQAVKLTATDNTSYLLQVDADTFDINFFPGLVALMTAWCKIDAAATIAVGDLLAEIVVTGAPGFWSAPFKADASIQPGSIFRVSIPIYVGAGVDWTAQARLYSVNGMITWDDVEIVFGDSTTVAQPGEDLSVFVQNIANYAQSSPWSNLGIASDLVHAGLTVFQGFEHAKHETIASAFRQLCDEHGCDIWVGIDRLLHFQMKRGQRRDDLAVTISVDDADDPGSSADTIELSGVEDLADITLTGDPSLASNVIIVAGENSTFAADEAGAVDLSVFGGLTLAKWIKAPPSAAAIDLSRIAQQRLEIERVPPVFPQIAYPLMENTPDPGDVIPIDIVFGWIQIAGDFRVETVTVDPATRTVKVDLDLDDGLPLTYEGS